MSFYDKKVLLALWPFSLFCGCESAPFALEQPDNRNVIEVKSGLYVHREVELRVHAARFYAFPEEAKSDAVPALNTTSFSALGTASTGFIPNKFVKLGDDLIWSETTHLSRDDYKGKTARGAGIRWEREGEVTISDGLEIFALPKPELSQIDNWSPWMQATSRRAGNFAWHAEANKHEAENVPPPAYPFQIRFRLILSTSMYP